MDTKVGKTTASADDEDCENEGDSTRVVEPVILENTNPTVTHVKGPTRTLTDWISIEKSASILTADCNIDNYGIVPIAVTDYAEMIIGTLVPECLPIATKVAEDDVKFEDPCCFGYTPLSKVADNGASVCNGYIEVIADPVCSVGSKLVGSRRETTVDDGMTTCIVESTIPVKEYDSKTGMTVDSTVHCKENE